MGKENENENEIDTDAAADWHFDFSFPIFIFHLNFVFLIYFCHRWYHTFLSVHNVNKGAYAELCSGLSKSLHQELKMHLFETLVLTAPFFQEIPSNVVVQMVMAFEEDVFAPGDLIINQGEVGTELFFVIKGCQ